MILLFAIGILLLGVTVALALRAAMFTRVRVASQVRQVGAYGFNVDARVSEGAEQAESQRLLTRLTALAGRIGERAEWEGWRAPVPVTKLRGAGLYTISPQAFQGYRVMLTLGLGALVLLDAVAGGTFSPLTVVLLVAVVGLAWMAPALLVGSRAERRMNRVDRDLPELIDLLIATIEAGLGFAGSLQMVADRFEGPLGQELRLTLHEQNLGLSTEQALANMLERCETQSVRAFVRAISQGESLGVSIGAMMRNLATETRKRRRQAANEQVQKAPIKMLFPLVFMVFPALLVVLLYPAIHQVLLQLGGS